MPYAGDDEEWVIEDPSESQPEEPPPKVEAPAAEAPAAEAAPPEAEAAAPQAEETKKQLFKHWVRPKFLQYNYMYDYRKKYYDDVINYLDRRNHGLVTEPPRAQTWAERALRMYMEKQGNRLSGQQDKQLLRHISSGARFYRYHSKSLISRKYSHLGFNCITI